MDRGRVGEERGSKEMDGCLLTESKEMDRCPLTVAPPVFRLVALLTMGGTFLKHV
jgi:hypothetical protein